MFVLALVNGPWCILNCTVRFGTQAKYRTASCPPVPAYYSYKRMNEVTEHLRSSSFACLAGPAVDNQPLLSLHTKLHFLISNFSSYLPIFLTNYSTSLEISQVYNTCFKTVPCFSPSALGQISPTSHSYYIVFTCLAANMDCMGKCQF